jgi:demethylmenaquinone methyltransferase/2-methoxy-6-polyprenyl-1,4-benzoquinol methylase
MPETETIKCITFDEDAARKKFDSVAKYYFWIMGALEIKPNNKALKMADIKTGEKVLDIGFGTGWVLERMVPLVGNHHITYGLDYSEGMKKVSLNNLKKKNFHTSVELTTANVKKMPYPDNTFDVVFVSFLLDLLPVEDIPKALVEIKRVLKPEGRFIVVSMTKNGNGIYRGARWLYEWMYYKWPTILGYRTSCRPIYIENDLLRAGFKIDDYNLTSIVGFMFPIAAIRASK